jgi:anti-sigma B factor antagonist
MLLRLPPDLSIDRLESPIVVAPMTDDGGDAREERTLRRELRPSGPVSLELSATRYAGRSLITVVGELDILTAPRVAALIDEVIRGREDDVTVDLLGTVFIDSAGLHILLGAKRRLTRRSRDLVVIAGPGPVLRALELARLTETLGVVSSREAADIG